MQRELFPSPLPVTMNDLLPWSIYDYFRGTYLRIPVIFFNPWIRTTRCAWHTSPESVYPHTRRLNIYHIPPHSFFISLFLLDTAFYAQSPPMTSLPLNNYWMKVMIQTLSLTTNMDSLYLSLLI